MMKITNTEGIPNGRIYAEENMMNMARPLVADHMTFFCKNADLES